MNKCPVCDAEFSEDDDMGEFFNLGRHMDHEHGDPGGKCGARVCFCGFTTTFSDDLGRHVANDPHPPSMIALYLMQQL